MKPLQITIIAVLFILMIVGCLQVLGLISTEMASESLTKSIIVVLFVGAFITSVYVIVRTGTNVSKENKSKNNINSGPDFN